MFSNLPGQRAILLLIWAAAVLFGCSTPPADPASFVLSGGGADRLNTPSPAPDFSLTELHPTPEGVKENPGSSLTRTAIILDSSTPTPVRNPLKVVEASAADLSALKHDLLFLSSGKMMVWNHVEGRVEEWLPPGRVPSEQTSDSSTALENGKIVKYLIDPYHRVLVFYRMKGIVANGIDLYELVFYDYGSSKLISLLEETPRLEMLALSPDANWVAYSPGTDGSLVLQSIDRPSMQRRLGDCTIDKNFTCTSLEWMYDSLQLSWSDSEGVWLHNVVTMQSQKVFSNTLPVTGLDGQITTTQVRFDDLQSSPQGRYLTARVRQEALAEFSWRGLIDTRRARVVEIPGTYGLSETAEQDFWSWDGRLQVVANRQEGDSSPVVTFWRIVPARGDLISKDTEFPLLPLDLMPSNGIDEDSPPLVSGLLQISQNRFSLIFQLEDKNEPAVLYQLDQRQGALEALTALPEELTALEWAPDGASAVILTRNGAYMFSSKWQAPLRSLSQVFGEDAQQFTWLP